MTGRRRDPRRAWLASILATAATLLLAGCDNFPRDPSHTLDDIRDRGVLRIGAERGLPPEASRLVGRLENATGAKAVLRKGAVEPLLTDLEAGDLDLVIAPFGKDTPWATMTALSPPLHAEGRGNRVIEWRAAMRSGENRWVMLVETEARKAAR